MKMTLKLALATVLGVAMLENAPQSVSAADTTSAGQKILHYTCPMHPSIKSDKPGDCPICGMHLVAVYAKPSGDGTNAPPTVTNTNTFPAIESGCCGGGHCH